MSYLSSIAKDQPMLRIAFCCAQHFPYARLFEVDRPIVSAATSVGFLNSAYPRFFRASSTPSISRSWILRR
jgi:hypothetical protein